MKKVIIFIFILLNLYSQKLNAQNRNSVWVFGDSTGIDFSNLATPQLINSSIDTRGSCVSIADTNGNLLYYAETNGSMSSNSTQLYNGSHQKIQNGDSILGQLWYHELITIPMPGNDSLYYLFSIGVSSVYGLKYSIINMKANGGLGAVIQKTFHSNHSPWWIV
ncbi:MAG: hypothetical protein IPP71_11975 [Bacteroidetes bacterium]|nr:hypothetical protein [Bacteroidota bacterium]